MNQANLLKSLDNDSYKKLYGYVDSLELYDKTNREGHAAKVYFNSLFGLSFSRDQENDINACLNYGYTILLSHFNKEIVSNGYITQLGMKHCNEYNHFNLASDIMEPFRPIIDKVVKENFDQPFTPMMKVRLLKIFDQKVRIKNSDQYLTNAISIYVKSIIKAIEKEDPSLIEFYQYEL